jgi:hypothetical protein
MYHHIYQRCLSRTAPHLMLPCNPQMSGTDSGPSAATMEKWSRKPAAGLAKERKQAQATRINRTRG